MNWKEANINILQQFVMESITILIIQEHLFQFTNIEHLMFSLLNKKSSPSINLQLSIIFILWSHSQI